MVSPIAVLVTSGVLVTEISGESSTGQTSTIAVSLAETVVAKKLPVAVASFSISSSSKLHSTKNL